MFNKQSYSYITVLSNWLLGYDRYQRLYSKASIPQSTYPNEFYLLKADDLEPGLKKAKRLLDKVNIQGNRIIRVETELDSERTSIIKNTRNGLGWYIKDHKIPVTRVYLYDDGEWAEKPVEEINALAFQLQGASLKRYQDLTPLTFSFLPIAIACQASCLFCFSGSSISVERKKRIKDFTSLPYWLKRAADAGAKRFVLTGGGEPTILPFEELKECISLASQFFPKTILITNGIFLSKCDEETIATRLKELKASGLDVLSFSYHHWESEGLKRIMSVDTNIQKVLEVWKTLSKSERPVVRLICVLQQGAVDSGENIGKYLDFAARYGVEQVCFKELYVSATTESLYSGGKENIYSRDHQVSLHVLLDWLKSQENVVKVKELAWGAPVFNVPVHTAASDNAHIVSVAAYTEPSVGWEKTHGIARSWNLMADQKCFASLEDEASEIQGER